MESKNGPKKIWYAPNQFEAYGEEEIKSVEQCLRDGWLAPGPRTALFENQVSTYFGKKYGVFVNSGSSANLLALSCLDLHPSDEVLTTALSFATVVAPIIQVGAKPVFVDVEADSMVADVATVISGVTANTKVIMLPNLAGQKPDWPALRSQLTSLNRGDIILLEDSCDTMTCTPETDIATTSFYASHVITAGGGGGMVMFNDESLKKKSLMYRDWGRIGDNSEDPSARFEHSVDGLEYDFKFLYGVVGYNFKSCEMNAAFGLEQMKKLESFQAIRKANVNRYVENLEGKISRDLLSYPPSVREYDWLAMPLISPYRSKLLRYLESNHVQTRVCFAGNITRHPAYRSYFQAFTQSDRIMREGILLGAHHGLGLDDVDRVCALIIAFFADKANYE